MPRNVYFSHGTRNEQLFHEDLIVESLSVYGQDMYYIPRTLIAKDEILGEDRLSEFKNAYPIEMYLENVDGFDGQGAFIQKFGLMMEQSATLVVARRRWDQLIGRHGATILPNRPAEGDLLYFPLTNGLFEIKFVQHQDPFYQIGKLFVYKLQIELFQYASERLDTGIQDIDIFQTIKTQDTSIIPNGVVVDTIIDNMGIGYYDTPDVIFGIDWEADLDLVDGAEICYGANRYIVSQTGTTGSTAPTHTSGVAGNGTAILRYAGTRATGTVDMGDVDTGSIMKIDITNGGNGYEVPPVIIFDGVGYDAAARAVIDNMDRPESYGDNNKFRKEAEALVFNESNPFGDILPPSATSTRSFTADTNSIFADDTTITADKV
jgi:hypothetical protein